MASLAKLQQQQVPLVVQEFFSKCRLAEERRSLEVKAVTTIQAYARGFLVRRRLLRFTRVSLTIQRWWRGYLGRLRAKLALELHNRALRLAYFNAMATIIQKWWRGYFSRKHVHDFYARKAYLHAIRERNEQIRTELNEEAERAIIAQRQEAEERARKLFSDKVSRLHHLVSTAQQPGIFNSPYSLATGTTPVVMGLPLEDHLKASMRAQLVQKLPPLQGSGKASSGGLMRSSQQQKQPVYPPAVEFNGKAVPARATLRQLADYDAVHQAQLLEEKIHRGEMLTQHPLPFTVALGKPKLPAFDLQTNRNLERYYDPFNASLGLKGDRFTPEQQKVSSAAFSKYIKKQPYFDPNTTEAY